MQRHHDLFDALRLLAAGLVLWSHHHALAGLAEPQVAALHAPLGGVGVFIFFAISGYLNAKSLLRRRDAASFLLARALRIYPAIIVCTLLTVAACASISTLDLLSFLGSTETNRFLVTNLALLAGQIHSSLPGVFAGSPAPSLVNGAVWTLPYELACYALLTLAAVAAMYRRLALGALMIVPIALAAANFDPVWFKVIAPMFTWSTIVGLSAVFGLGALMAVAESRVSKAASYAAALLLITSLLITGHGYLAALLALGAVSVIVGQQPAPVFLTPRHDISYGLYIYAFPVQQLALSFAPGFWASLALTIPCTVGLAYMSCRLVEEPALRLKAHIYAGTLLQSHARLQPLMSSSAARISRAMRWQAAPEAAHIANNK